MNLRARRLHYHAQPSTERRGMVLSVWEWVRQQIYRGQNVNHVDKKSVIIEVQNNVKSYDGYLYINKNEYIEYRVCSLDLVFRMDDFNFRCC